MKIVRLEVSNFKRIRAIDIVPKGPVVQVRGKNGAGKSSVLDSIPGLLGGEKLCPKEPIRRGETEGMVRATLDQFPEFGRVIAERRFRRSEDGSISSALKLYREQDGLKLDKPQRRLDELIGRLSFDPLAYVRLPAKEQAETLRKLSGVDFSLLDAKRQKAYEERTLANRSLAQIRARLAAMPAVEAPDAPESSAALNEEQDRRRALHDANEAKRRELAAARQKYEAIERRIAMGHSEIAKLEKALADARALLAGDQKDLDACKARGVALKAEVDVLADPNLEEIPAKLRELDAVNDRVRRKKERAVEAARLADAEKEAARLESEIDAIDAHKAKTLADAALPVEGLSFTDDGVTFDDLPLEQASQAQQIRISVAIGSAINPELRAMLVRDGSLLDEDSLALLEEEAAKADLQVWLEVVGKGGDGIVIEDGQVEGAEAPAEAAHA